MQGVATTTIRAQFEENRDAVSSAVPAMLRIAEEAVEFLSKNVVQAPLNERGNYTVDAKKADDSRVPN